MFTINIILETFTWEIEHLRLMSSAMQALKLSVAELPLADVEAVVKWLNFGGSCPEEALHKVGLRLLH